MTDTINLTVEEARKIIGEDWKDTDSFIQNIYENGGVTVTGWGFISSGFGGGVEQDQALSLIYVSGYLDGLAKYSPERAKKIVEAINCLLEDMGVAKEELPFRPENIIID